MSKPDSSSDIWREAAALAAAQALQAETLGPQCKTDNVKGQARNVAFAMRRLETEFLRRADEDIDAKTGPADDQGLFALQNRCGDEDFTT